jgi:SpoVK/Ycf46/Vps4 family AAA+-type ATPase
MSSNPSTGPASSLPAWFLDDVITPFTAGIAHGFILCGDVWGATIQGISQRRFLQQVLVQAKLEIVAYYNRACGITFPLESMLSKAEELCTGTTPSVESDPFNSVLDAAGMGVQPKGDQFSAARRPLDALALLEQLLRSPSGRRKVAVIIDFADLLCPRQDKFIMSPDDRLVLSTLLWWGQDEELAACGNPLFLVTRKASDIHDDLRSSGSGYRLVEIPLPKKEERFIFLSWYLQKREEEEKPIPLEGGLTGGELANLTAGLSLRHLEDILLLGAKAGVSRTLIKARKDAIITSEFSEIAEMIEPLPGGFGSIGGMDRLIGWTKKEIIQPIRAGLVKDVPKGVLLAGPPGTGKTRLVRAISAEIGFNCVALRSENILGGIVGESEGKLKEFFAFAVALAPVLVFMDEIDQSDMSRRGNGSGNPVASNLFNQMLQFMSDESLRGKVLVIFASNRPDLIDRALLRFGRVDAIIPVLLPEEAERRDIILAQAREQAVTVTDDALNLLASRTDKYSPADLAAVVTKARKLAVRTQQDLVNREEIEEALRLIRPATPAIADYYTLLAVQACNDAELLPPRYAKLLEDREALQARVKASSDGTTAPSTRNERTWGGPLS